MSKIIYRIKSLTIHNAWFIISVSSLLTVGLIRFFLLETFLVISDSMSPTLKRGDQILVLNLQFLPLHPDTRDVVIFREPSLSTNLSGQNNALVVKRVTHFFSRSNTTGIPKTNQARNSFTQTDNTDGYFLEGDNHLNSYDSKHYGPIKKKDLLFKALFIFYPFSRMGIIY